MWKVWLVRVGVGAALVGIGAGATFVIMARRSTEGDAAGATEALGTLAELEAAETSSRSLPDFEFSLSEEAVERAGLEIATVTTRSLTTEIRVPGVVEPNAYRTVSVTSLVNGRVVAVPVELGERVGRGQTLATIFSPDLAESQTRYLSAKADFEYDHQVLKRTERLVEIGAASLQELEEVRAMHTRHEIEMEGARSRLILLGLEPEQVERLTSPDEVSATVSVPAPVAGVVLRRTADPGLVVDTSSELFTVSDLSTVWVVGAVYERDFLAVGLTSPATLTSPAYPGVEFQGHVDYIDPQVNEETRTAEVRVEVPNPDGRLRLGMYVDVRIDGPEQPATVVAPREAVQLLGERSVVYLVSPTEEGRFTEREVTLGRSTVDDVEVLEGLKPGDVVVTEGSFYVRAERERSFPNTH
ncbi:MAG: efflux RND transporter periplasmic adaptor subunit [Vicinamibacteria bacterium]